jgi:hypothetical protein
LEQVPFVIRDQLLSGRKRRLFFGRSDSLSAQHVKKSIQRCSIAMPGATQVFPMPQESMHNGLIQGTDFGVHPPEPTDELGDESDLVLNRYMRVALLLDQFGVGVYILGPTAKLRVQRSERLFFHPTTMTSQMLPDYAESLRRKTAQLADVVEVFGMFRDSA